MIKLTGLARSRNRRITRVCLPCWRETVYRVNVRAIDMPSIRRWLNIAIPDSLALGRVPHKDFRQLLKSYLELGEYTFDFAVVMFGVSISFCAFCAFCA